jgi:hypothetical protein
MKHTRHPLTLQGWNEAAKIKKYEGGCRNREP